LEKAINSIVDWTRAYKKGSNMTEICLKQVEEYNLYSG